MSTYTGSYAHRAQDYPSSAESSAGRLPDIQPFQLGRGYPIGAHMARFGGWTLLILMVGAIAFMRPELDAFSVTALLVFIILIVPWSTTGVMLIFCGLEAIARRERRQIIDNQARLIAQNEQITAMLSMAGMKPVPLLEKFDTTDLKRAKAYAYVDMLSRNGRTLRRRRAA